MYIMSSNWLCRPRLRRCGGPRRPIRPSCRPMRHRSTEAGRRQTRKDQIFFLSESHSAENQGSEMEHPLEAFYADLLDQLGGFAAGRPLRQSAQRGRQARSQGARVGYCREAAAPPLQSGWARRAGQNEWRTGQRLPLSGSSADLGPGGRGQGAAGVRLFRKVFALRGHFRQHRMLSEPAGHLAREIPGTAHIDQPLTRSVLEALVPHPTSGERA